MRYRYIGGNNYDIDCILETSEEFKKLQAKEDKISLYNRKSFSLNEEKKNLACIQFLIAHYLGITAALTVDNHPKVRLLQYLFSAEGISSIKKYLSSDNKSVEPFTITNLEKVYLIFEETGFIKQCRQIQADLVAINNYAL